MGRIEYRSGYKYQLQSLHVFPDVGIHPSASVGNLFVRLDPSGDLTVFTGYAWDGPSGPAPDLRSLMRGSLAHDALYQLMREGMIDHERSRDEADRLLRDVCIADGTWRPLAWLVYLFVRLFASFAADPANGRPIEYAP